MRVIAANWKMHKTVKETQNYIKTLKEKLSDIKDREIVIFPPFTSLYKAAEESKGSNIKIGAQNCFYENKGAYTGEISPLMLKDVGCDYVIIGHSERRHIFNEKDELINKKVTKAIEEGLRVILCVGETIEEKEANITFKVIETQLRLGLSNVESFLDKVDIAYEPVWAIGTGLSAKPEDTVIVHRFIRDILNELDTGKSDNVRILYGGSVNKENAKEFMAHKEIDGLLVGSASLDVDSFFNIINSF